MGHLTNTAVMADIDNQALLISGRLGELKELRSELDANIGRHELVLRMIADVVEKRRELSLMAGNGITEGMATGREARDPQPYAGDLPVYPAPGEAIVPKAAV